MCLWYRKFGCSYGPSVRQNRGVLIPVKACVVCVVCVSRPFRDPTEIGPIGNRGPVKSAVSLSWQCKNPLNGWSFSLSLAICVWSVSPGALRHYPPPTTDHHHHQKPRSARSPSHYPKQRTTSRAVFHRRACCRDHPSATSTVSALYSALLAAEPFADRFAPTVFARPMPTARHRVSRIIVLQSFCAHILITAPISP